ncbi:MAG: hypothetical protein QNJ44_22720 [Rhodobacter sp.]|nr:hypothetical protein [Rhodobacter sp.]
MLTEPLKLHRWRRARKAFKGLERAFEAHRASHLGGTLAVGGSWAGPKTLFDDCPEPTIGLRKWLATLLPAGSWTIDAWGVLHQVGDRLTPHDHVKSHRGGNNLWAGVYWLDPAGDGDLFCYRMAADLVEVAPVAGAALLFPADLVHSTTPATQARRAIAFNVQAAGQ